MKRGVLCLAAAICAFAAFAACVDWGLLSRFEGQHYLPVQCDRCLVLERRIAELGSENTRLKSEIALFLATLIEPRFTPEEICGPCDKCDGTGEAVTQ